MSGSNRRRFLTTASAGMAGLATPARPSEAAVPKRYPQPSDQLSGGNLEQLLDAYRTELFDVQLPFWSAHGIDHRLGGFMTALDYDGTRLSDNKLHWYQGRGIWVYSFLYNHLGGDPRHLEIASKAKEFWIEHAPPGRRLLCHRSLARGRDRQAIRTWRGWGRVRHVLSCGGPAGVRRSGRGRRSARGSHRAAQEDVRLRQPARLQGQNTRRIRGPAFKATGWSRCKPSRRYSTAGPDPELESIADFCVDAILHKHHNPEIGLTNEYRNHDFSPIPSERNKSLLGHCCQCLWMVMDEALRRGDQAMFRLGGAASPAAPRHRLGPRLRRATRMDQRRRRAATTGRR